ncbi:MAG: hypothetical protein ACI4EE_13000 [Lachnospiraceae bacterium]
MYEKIYCCRLCKKIVTEKLENKTYPDIAIKVLNQNDYIKNQIHYCNDTDIGILEFVGIKMCTNHQY